MEQTKEPKTTEFKGIWVQNEIWMEPVPINTDAPFEFKGKNVSDGPLMVRGVPTCGCTSANVEEFKVGPGAEFSITGYYKKTSTLGKFTRRVHLYFGEKSTSDASQKISLTFNGEIVTA